MKVLCHHIYEYKKGLRNLVLHTMCSSDVKLAEEKLFRYNIAYFIQHVTSQKVNIFFGKEQCVKIIQSFNRKSLTDFTHEEDFILGIMLGYDRMQQCERYIIRSHKKEHSSHIKDIEAIEVISIL
jgi:hypothetical protein